MLLEYCVKVSKFFQKKWFSIGQIILLLVFIYITMVFVNLSDGAAPNCVMLCEHRIKGRVSIKYQIELL